MIPTIEEIRAEAERRLHSGNRADSIRFEAGAHFVLERAISAINEIWLLKAESDDDARSANALLAECRRVLEAVSDGKLHVALDARDLLSRLPQEPSP